jgi:hypothetical protein
MSSWNSYPKLFHLGHPSIAKLFDGPVTIEEKVDGSQFSFGLIDGEVRCKSKRVDLNLTHVDKMFSDAVATVKRLADEGKLTPGYTYRGEVLASPKHNTLAYERAPTGNIIVFDVATGLETYMAYEEKRAEAERLGLECVPQIYVGDITGVDGLSAALNRVSVLGGAKIEGIVIKNYSQFGPDAKPLMAKLVSEEFKEIHNGDWRDRNPSNGDILEIIALKFTTPARWQKAVQRLRDDGRLTSSPKDIGELIKEVNLDIRDECAEEIKQMLFDWAWNKVSRKFAAGLPQWYQNELIKQQFNQAE